LAGSPKSFAIIFVPLGSPVYGLYGRKKLPLFSAKGGVNKATG
jgi:hypothetical protein